MTRTNTGSCYTNYRSFLTALMLCFLFGNTPLFAQEPAHFFLGEEQFKGVKIYDIIQDDEQNFWISTDEGIYLYDFYTFKRVEAENAKSNSVFNFVRSGDGTIYCNNLSNQIFQIKNKVCRLLYEMPSSEAGVNIHLETTPKNNLMVAGRYILLINPKGKKIFSYYGLKHPWLSVNKFPDNSIQLLTSDNVLHILKDGKVTTKKTLHQTVQLAQAGEASLAFDPASLELYHYNYKAGTIAYPRKLPINEQNKGLRYYSASGRFWIAGTTLGVSAILPSSEGFSSQQLFSDCFISDVYQDDEGNTLLATFDKGIIVVPDMRISGVIPPYGNGAVIALYSDPVLGLVSGTDQGDLFARKQGNYRQLMQSGDDKRPIEGVYGNDQLPFLIVGNGPVYMLDKVTGKTTAIVPASLKDVAFVSGKQCYIATNKGLFSMTWKGGTNFECHLVANINYRLYALEYDNVSNTLYFSSTKGLMQLHGETIKPVKYQNKDLFVNDFVVKDGIVCAATQNFGILKIKEGRVIGSIIPKINGSTESINKFLLVEDYIIASTATGFYRFSTTGTMLDAMHISNSFASKRVFDFSLNGSTLWVSHYGGVQAINIDYHLKTPKNALLRFSRILANGADVKHKHDFSPAQNKFVFELASPSLRNRGSGFSYKLNGYDQYWQRSENSERSVVYNALPPGEYLFLVRRESTNGDRSGLSYRFVIAPPVYQRWWFLLACMAVIYLGYRFIRGNVRKTIAGKLEYVRTMSALRLAQLESFETTEATGEIALAASEFVTVEQQIASLETFFKAFTARKGNVEVSIDGTTDTSAEILSLCVFPFVKHALQYDFDQKVGTREVKIQFKTTPDGVRCIIEDNIPRFSNARQQRKERDLAIFRQKALAQRLEVLENQLKNMPKVHHLEKISGEQMLGTILTVDLPTKK